MKTTLKCLSLLALLVSLALGQTTTTSTTLSAAIGTSDTTMLVASATGFTARGTLQQDVTLAMVDRELMSIATVNGTVIGVIRGRDGTPVTPHASGAQVWVGPASNGPFIANGAQIGGQSTLSGACTAANLPYLPMILTATGDAYTCPTSGPQNGTWTIQQRQPAITSTGQAWVTCTGAVSGNSTGTNGFTTVGTNAVGVYNLQTSNSGTNTHVYTCTFNPRYNTLTNRGVSVTKVEFFYGVQSNALGTQASTGSSGTFNSVQVFNTITYPTAGASETASSNTLGRADSGTLVLTPAVASFNTATTTAGTFYSELFTPATPITFNTDLQQMQITIALQCAATTATITNSPGAIVYYTISD